MQPLNLGSSEMVSMNEMMEMAMSFEEKNLPIKHIPGPEVCASCRSAWVLLPGL